MLCVCSPMVATLTPCHKIGCKIVHSVQDFQIGDQRTDNRIDGLGLATPQCRPARFLSWVARNGTEMTSLPTARWTRVTPTHPRPRARALPGLGVPTLRGKALTLTLELLEGFIRSQDKSLPGRSVRTTPVGGSVCGFAGLFIPAAPGVVIPALPGRALAHRRCQRERQHGCRLGLGRAQIDFRRGIRSS